MAGEGEAEEGGPGLEDAELLLGRVAEDWPDKGLANSSIGRREDGRQRR